MFSRSVTRLVGGVLLGALCVTLGVNAPVAHADEVRDRQYWLDEFGITDAWSVTRGAGVTIAIIDTGVDGNHEDLRGAVIGGTDVSGLGSANGQTPVGSSSEHGTMVASLAAGRGHGGGVGGYCVPNAQHAVRQGKHLAKNLTAVLRGEEPKDYFHKNLGAVAGLGVGVGVLQVGNFALTGFLGFLAHRGYHGLAMPMWERKVRVVSDWLLQLFWGRDVASIRAVQKPREFFEEFATRPAPAAEATAKKRASKAKVSAN